MVKFINLIKNEYIKIFKKKSTIIMLIVIILSAIGLSGLSAYEKRSLTEYSSYTIDDDDYNAYQAEIQWLENSKPEGYQTDIKIYNYLIENVNELYGWQEQFAFDLRENIDESLLFSVLDDTVGGGDWKAACKVLIDHSENEAKKWEYSYRLENEIPFGDTWKDDVIADVVEAKTALASYDESEAKDMKLKEEQEKIGLYRLENNISENTADSMLSSFEAGEANQITFWSVFFHSASLISVIGLLLIIIAGNSIAVEFSYGTIKFLLINPIKRWKILIAKYFTVISIGYLMLFLLYAVMIPIAGITMGFDGISAPYLYISGGEVHEMSSFLHALRIYLLNSIEIIVMATFAFAVSSLFKSAAFAIGSSVFLMLSGTMIVEMLAMLNQDWARYLIFANLDISGICNGQSMFPQHSPVFALLVITAHIAVFLLTAWDGFNKREV